MAAWKHTKYWSVGSTYEQYRRFVRAEGPSYEGRTEDCADISMLLLVEFASQSGLPVTFTGGDGAIYCSKATQQHPSDPRYFHTYSWSDKEGFTKAVRARIGSKTLYEHNTEPNPVGPEAGDLMLQVGHAALVLDWYAPGRAHPRAKDALAGLIPVFPGPDEAKRQLDTTRYFRGDPKEDPKSTDPKGRFDYLNHRGVGVDAQHIKQKAELIYAASVSDIAGQGFEFRRYTSEVLDDWSDWDGVSAPPRRLPK